MKGGILGPRPLTTADVEALADVPPREVLLARLAGGFQAPLTKAAGLFQAFTRNMAYGVKAYIDQRIEAGEAAPADGAGGRIRAGARSTRARGRSGRGRGPGRRDRDRSDRGGS